MADHPLYVRYPDGEIRYGAYQSSIDLALHEVFPTREAGRGRGWFRGHLYDEALSGAGEPVELATSYGGGFYWSATATRDWITSNWDPFDSGHRDGTPLWLAEHFADGIRRLAESEAG